MAPAGTFKRLVISSNPKSNPDKNIDSTKQTGRNMKINNPIFWNRRMSGWRETLIAAVLALAAGPAGFCAGGGDPADAAGNAKVGDRGELETMVFTGQTSFSDRALRQALKCDMNFLLAARPDANLAVCLKTLEADLRAGYLHAGFGQATIRASLDADGRRIEVAIGEGPQSVCGDVIVKGVTNLSAGTLAARVTWRISSTALTNPPPGLLDAVGSSNLLSAEQILRDVVPSSAATQITNRSQVPDVSLGIWETGQPTPLDAGARRSISEAVTNAFADLGYFSPQFEWKFEPRPPRALTPAQQRLLDATNTPPEAVVFLRAQHDGRLLDLVVAVRDEGPPCVIGDIVVTGAEKNSREELLRWLNLTPGQRLTRELLLEKDRQLFDSGRFASVSLEPGSPDPARKVTLRIAVDELKEAPKLTEPLSDIEAAMLQLRNWLVNWPSQHEDLVVRGGFRGGEKGRGLESVEILISPDGGILFNARTVSAADGAPVLEWALLAGGSKAGYYNGAHREKFELTNFTAHVVLNIALDAHNFAFAAGCKNATSGPPFLAQLNLAPVAFLKLASMTNLNLRLRADELTIHESNLVFRANAKTGRPLELHVLVPPGADLPFINNGVTLDVLFETNALAHAKTELARTIAGLTNRYDADRPFSSSLIFLAEEVFRSPLPALFGFTNVMPEHIASASAALDKLSAAKIFTPLERLGPPTNSSPEEISMIIPPAGDEAASGNVNPLDWVAIWVLRDDGNLVPRTSWMAALLREKALALTRYADPGGAGWRRLYESDDTGPLGYWVIAQSANVGTRQFAIRGMTRLSRDDFHKDCRALLEGDAILNECLRNFLEAARGLSDADVESFCGLMDADDADIIRSGMKALRKTRGPVTVANLTPALDEWWDGALRARVSAALRELAIRPDNPPQSP
jgi:hypothetical protein